MFDAIEIKDVKMEIGLLVRALRKQSALSQLQLAETLNVSRATIQNMESGKNFTIDTILKVLKEMDQLALLKSEIERAKNQAMNTQSLY